MHATQIYMIRHGQSEANEKNLSLGHGELPLTALGRAQAMKTAEYLKTIPVDAIYSSDLSRAYDTANTTASIINMSIIKDKNLREVDLGKWDLRTYEWLLENYQKEYGLWIEDIDKGEPDGGEPISKMKVRIFNAVERIAKENAGKTVFIFSHAIPIRIMAAYCKNPENPILKQVPWASNASVSHLEYNENGFSMVEYSKDDFLGDMITVLPDKA